MEVEKMVRYILKRLVLLSSVGALALSVSMTDSRAPLNFSPTKALADTTSSNSPLPLANPNIFADLAASVVPSVVNISATINTTDFSGESSQEERFRRDFENFFGFRAPHPGGGYAPAPPLNRQPQGALGTGVVIDVAKDYATILTNYHVVNGASALQIQFDTSISSEKREGIIQGKDKDLDLALIRVSISEDLKGKVKALPFGDSDALRVGEYVMAVGNPFGQGHSVSHGIVSGKDRIAPIIGKYLQTDAPINPGNSGGPLVNLKGQIIGINNAILAQAQGIGFAIPSNSIQNVIDQLKNSGRVERGYLGIMIGQVSPEAAAFSGGKVQSGVPFISQVESGSPAQKAGLAANDVLISINKKAVKTPQDVLMEVTSQPIGSHAQVRVLRAGKEKSFSVPVSKRPS
jgi:serine protease Do